MVLDAHSDDGFHNESKVRSQAEDHVFLAEYGPIPIWNGPILTIAQVIKFVMSLEAEAEIGAILVTAKELVPMSQTMIEMEWPQPPTPIQIENSTAAKLANYTIIVQKTKFTDLRLHWLRFREAKQKFPFYWDPGSKNWSDYITKHHPPIYYKSKHPLFEGADQRLYQFLLEHC